MLNYEGFRKIRLSKHLIVLDTNIFLELYRQPANISNDIIAALKLIFNNLYIPRQVYDEYIKRYQEICGSEKKKYQKVSRKLTELLRKLQDGFSSEISEYRKHNYTDINKLQADLTKKVDELESIIKAFENDHKSEIDYNLDFLNNDKVKEFIDLLVENEKIGQTISLTERLAILHEGEVRFDNLIPPGYKDCEKKGAEKYGDLFIWKNIIKVAKEKDANIIFVCNDIKEDWWEYERENPIDLRNELGMEFKETNSILNIHFLTLDKFFSYIAEELHLGKSKSALQLSAMDEAKDLLDAYNDEINREIEEVLSGIDVEKELNEEYLDTADEVTYWEISNVSVEKEEKIISYFIDLNISVLSDLTYREPGDYPYSAGVVALVLNGKIEITKEEYSTCSNIKKIDTNFIEMRHIEPVIWKVIKGVGNEISCKQLIKANDALELYRNTNNINGIKVALNETLKDLFRPSLFKKNSTDNLHDILAQIDFNEFYENMSLSDYNMTKLEDN